MLGQLDLTNDINRLYYSANGHRVTSIAQKDSLHKKTKWIFCLKIL